MIGVIPSAARDRLDLVRRYLRSLPALGMTALLPFALRAQDTTQAYPWRLSYFPYIAASPNDGVMGMARAVVFRQSRWDDRVSVHDQVAIEGGYSTKNSWLVRARGDFPRIADGWRLQVIAQAGKEANLLPVEPYLAPTTRQIVSVDVSRRVAGPVYLALRGDAMHLNATAHFGSFSQLADVPFPGETDYRSRIALVLDLRNREYDTRDGALLQTGVFAGTAGGGYHGWYGLASGWHSLSATTRITARIGARAMSPTDTPLLDAPRIMPGWEDEFNVLGGPESNRALAVGEQRGRGVLLSSAEVRHDLFTFPGGAVALIGFVDAGRVFFDLAEFNGGGVTTLESGDLRLTFVGWTVGAGAGVAVRLLRDAVLTATVGRAEHATRVYVSSGWSW